jgi:hypothetical protein
VRRACLVQRPRVITKVGVVASLHPVHEMAVMKP